MRPLQAFSLGLFTLAAIALQAAPSREWTPPPASAPAAERLKFLERASAAQIKDLLRSQPDLRTLKDEDGNDALACALVPGGAPETRLEEIEALLNSGFDARTTLVRGEPALFALFTFHPDRHLPVIKLLLRYGADLKVTTSQGKTLLMTYCTYGHDPAVIASLIARGIAVNAKSTNNDCALDRALYAKWTEGARALLDAGADYTLTGNTLAIAARNYDLPSMKLLHDRGLKQDQHGTTALHCAISNWNIRNTQYRDAPDRTQLDGSVLAEWEQGRAAILAFIEYAPETVALEARNGETALSRTQDLQMARALIAAGADPRAPRSPENRSITPLSTACETSFELTRYYVGLGLDIHSLADYSTPLQHALRRAGNFDTVRYLIELGADVNVVAPRNNIATPLAAAIWGQGKDQALYVGYLLAHGADPKVGAAYNIEACIEARRPDLLKTLVAHGLVVTASCARELSSPLTKAVDKQDPAMVRLLLELGADPFEQLVNRRTVIDQVRNGAKFQPDTPEKKEIFDLLTSLKPPVG